MNAPKLRRSNRGWGSYAHQIDLYGIEYWMSHCPKCRGPLALKGIHRDPAPLGFHRGDVFHCYRCDVTLKLSKTLRWGRWGKR